MSATDIVTGLAFVLVIEGLAYVLAPSLVERLLELLRAVPEETRRMMGLTMVVAGVAMLWAIYGM
ncbi:MAG: DUF2065 domain-containing protein [Roseivivax sp.]|nr:DUF2065 domain-containing protein [Roseivivax sp.]